MARLILDSNLLIEAERQRGRVPLVAAEDNVAIAAVTLAELEEGVFAAKTPQMEVKRRQFVDHLLENVEVLPYTEKTAIEHAFLLRQTRLSGRPRGAHDLIIAAHARETGRVVTTNDRRARFGGLPGVTVRFPEDS